MTPPPALVEHEDAQLEQVAAAQPQPAACLEFPAGRARPLLLADAERQEQPLIEILIERLRRGALHDLPEQERAAGAVGEGPRPLGVRV